MHVCVFHFGPNHKMDRQCGLIGKKLGSVVMVLMGNFRAAVVKGAFAPA